MGDGHVQLLEMHRKPAAGRHDTVGDLLDGYTPELAWDEMFSAPDEPSIKMFAEHAAGAITVERQLHKSFFAELGLTETVVAATPMAPTNLAYCSYLLSSAYGGSFAEALGAVLPCCWIYERVGSELLSRGSPDPLYARWIDTYGGEEFRAVVQAVLELTDRIGRGLSDADRAAAAARFTVTARYEWMFWDMGWRQETWPV